MTRDLQGMVAVTTHISTRAQRSLRARLSIALPPDRTSTERGQSLRRCTSKFVVGLAGAALASAVVAEAANAGTYKVANCAADPISYSTAAFNRVATRGMHIRLACDPKASGTMTIGNVKRKGTVKRRSLAALTLDAPPGTRFVNFWWAGEAKRTDCRFDVQMWAEGPDARITPIVNLRANERCPKRKKRRSKSGKRFIPVQLMQITKERSFPKVAGATRIVQRVICRGGGGREHCSAGGTNRFLTHRATVEVEDVQPPVATILEAPAPGSWVPGSVTIKYDATDNIGILAADAMVGGRSIGRFPRTCAFSEPQQTFSQPLPCPNGPASVRLITSGMDEGVHSVVLRVFDPAGNFGDAKAIPIGIDRTAPGRVDTFVEGGQNWRSRNDFAVWWRNVGEANRAPISGVVYKLCPAAGGKCITGEHAAVGISRISAPVPGPGQWKLSVWRRDAAGNASEQMASVPVTLRYDPDPPELGFEPAKPTDPTAVAVKVSDPVSGFAEGAIEISAVGSGTWHTLPATRVGDRLVTRINDAGLPPGQYALRARAKDQAGNEASSNLRLDGAPMLVNLPIRVVSTLQNAFERQRTVKRGGKRERTTIQTQTARVPFGETANVTGRLVDPAGVGIPGAQIQVLATTPLGPEQPLGVVQTDAEGRYAYTATGSSNQTLRFVYAGSATVLPAEGQLSMTVPAATALRVNRKRLRNGQTVTFTGPVRSLPTPPGGKMIEMQVRLPGRWETFRTIRSDDAGNWSVRYRFRRTTGVQYYRFRARLPAEGSYPFTTGVSRVVTVRVRGR